MATQGETSSTFRPQLGRLLTGLPGAPAIAGPEAATTSEAEASSLHSLFRTETTRTASAITDEASPFALRSTEIV
jgi:hypothetical protein